MTNPQTEGLLAELYAPPAPAETTSVVTELAAGGVLVSFFREGQRYAATGATEADARALLTEHPEMCLVRF